MTRHNLEVSLHENNTLRRTCVVVTARHSGDPGVRVRVRIGVRLVLWLGLGLGLL